MIPEIYPPRCAKFATEPKPNKSKIPTKPNINHTIINKYKAGANITPQKIENKTA